jgi:hypothetical protein
MEKPGGIRRVLNKVSTRTQLTQLTERIAELENEVQESRRLNRRIAELTDVVQELLLPLAARDQTKIEVLYREYASGAWGHLASGRPAGVNVEQARAQKTLPRTLPRVVIHLGAPKTGTTYLQGLLNANRDSLAAANVILAGRRWQHQMNAVRDVLQFRGDPRQKAADEGMWRKLTKHMLEQDSDATVVLSMEFLSFADRVEAQRVLDAFTGCELELVLGVRDTADTLPAQWQTECSNGIPVSWPDFLAGAREVITASESEPTRGARIFQRTQGIPRIIETWAPLVPPGHFSVITVPARGAPPSLLWERLAEVLGVSPEVANNPPPHVNTSLGYASAELVRRLNEQLSKLPKSDYNIFVKRRLCRDVLSLQAKQESAIPVDGATYAAAAQWNERMLQVMHKHQVRIVGSEAELPTTPRISTVTKVDPPADAELYQVSDIAGACLTELLASLGGSPAESPQDATLERRVRYLADLVMECAQLSRAEPQAGADSRLG